MIAFTWASLIAGMVCWLITGLFLFRVCVNRRLCNIFATLTVVFGFVGMACAYYLAFGK